VETVLGHYVALTNRAAAQDPRPDLIAWPETSYPADWMDLSADFPPERLNPHFGQGKAGHPEKPITEDPDWRTRVRKHLNADALAYARAWRTEVLLGLNAQVLSPDERVQRYNSAILIGKDGQVAGRYDKVHRVPFGEYVPLRDWFPFMNRFAPYDFDYSIRPGEHLARLPLRTEQGEYHFGVIICFEDTDPDLARQYVRDDGGEAAADFLLNISNDGWFKGTREHEEHLAICRFRAVECRRAVARAVNMGVSAVIDGNGRVVALPGPTWAESKKVPAVLTAVVPLDRRASLYARWGDWLPWGCWLVLGLGLVGSVVRRPVAEAGGR
jgi:apolipoprotein N-acyltransferase